MEKRATSWKCLAASTAMGACLAGKAWTIAGVDEIGRGRFRV